MDLEARTVARVTRRLVPFLIVCYVIAYLDRVNVGFAALTMNRDLNISSTAYGLGAGIFFLSYFVFEVPANLFLQRLGARKWIARIMLSWGLLSGGTAFIQGETSFYALRFLLGMAEAGFFPGIIFYLTLWFPAAYRARIMGYFMAAIPFSSLLGAPVSGALLMLDGWMGLKGWQWMFIIEAAPAVLLSLVVHVYLTDCPAEAAWLPKDERDRLSSRLGTEERHRVGAQHFSVTSALFSPKVLGLSLVYFGAVACNYGIGFFLPQIVKGFGLTNLETGLVTAIPYAAGVAGMIFWRWNSDRMQERKVHAGISLAIASLGIAASTYLPSPTLKMLALSISAFGVFGCLPVFWTLPASLLSGAAGAAGGIVIINSIGNLSGFAAPYLVGTIKDRTGGFNGGLLCLAAFGAIATVIVLTFRHNAAPERGPQSQVYPAQ